MFFLFTSTIKQQVSNNCFVCLVNDSCDIVVIIAFHKMNDRKDDNSSKSRVRRMKEETYI